MARLKPKRMARYQYLKGHHFTHYEAVLLSRLKRKYPALKKMVAQREEMWSDHIRFAKKNKLNKDLAHRYWMLDIRQFYKSNGWIVEKNVHGMKYKYPKPSVWDWYDNVFRQLPPEARWDTPRSKRVKTKEPDLKMEKVVKLQWTNELRQSIRRERDPVRRDQLRLQLRRLSR